MRYLGIDPGVTGAIAAVDDAKNAWVCPCPRSNLGVKLLLEKLTENGTRKCHAVLEHVWSSPGWGHAGSFTFGCNFGAWEAHLTWAGIPYDLVVPIKWMNVMEVRTPKERREELGHADKNINKARAEELFPGIKVTHAVADALLLAAYARHIYPGLLAPTEPAF